ncbi:hypothetical protein T484DRAFT_1852905, partial [Baffinella frigidus]
MRNEMFVGIFFGETSFTAVAVLISASMRNEMFVGIFFGETSFTAVAVLISAVSAIDLTCTLQSLSRSDPLMGNFKETVTPVAKVLVVALTLFGIFIMALQHVRMVKHCGLYFGASGSVIEVEAALHVRTMLSHASFCF